MSTTAKQLTAMCSDLDMLADSLVSASLSPTLPTRSELNELKYKEMLKFFQDIKIRELQKHIDILTEHRDLISLRNGSDDIIEVLDITVDRFAQMEELMLSLKLIDYNDE